MAALDGRVALVTGAARGIGAETAALLAEAGAAVVLSDVLIEDGEATAARLSGQGQRALFLAHDVTREEAWAHVVARCEEHFGGLDILVNNAGIFLWRSIAETSLADFRRVQAVNTEGVFLGLKAAIPAIAKRAARWPGGGAIVNLSSSAGIVGSPNAIAYQASKGAVRIMTKAAAMECAAKGLKIRVNSVHPGFVETAMGEAVVAGNQGANSLERRARAREQMMKAHPLGRTAEPRDIAAAILFLASDAASFITGVELPVDGGFTAR